MGLPIILIKVVILTMCNICKSDEMKTVIEWDHVQIDFPYPCDSTRVTLQYGIRLPFYTLTDSELISLASDQENRFHVKNGSNQCSLNLVIDPVVRSDAGTYICLSYGADQESYIYRVGLDVDFPPGKVTCTPSEGRAFRNWAALSCTAPIGSLSGQIECYQNEECMPPITAPIESDWYLKQTILVHKDAYPVFCCSSILEQTKDRCECNDYHLDLTKSEIEGEMSEPCGSSTLEYIQVENSEIMNIHAATTLIHVPTVVTEIITNKNNSNNLVSKKIVVLSTLLAITTCISIILLIKRFRSRSTYEKVTQSSKNINESPKSDPKEQSLCQTSSITQTSHESPKPAPKEQSLRQTSITQTSHESPKTASKEQSLRQTSSLTHTIHESPKTDPKEQSLRQTSITQTSHESPKGIPIQQSLNQTFIIQTSHESPKSVPKKQSLRQTSSITQTSHESPKPAPKEQSLHQTSLTQTSHVSPKTVSKEQSLHQTSITQKYHESPQNAPKEQSLNQTFITQTIHESPKTAPKEQSFRKTSFITKTFDKSPKSASELQPFTYHDHSTGTANWFTPGRIPQSC